jgi:hypothetical protein
MRDPTVLEFGAASNGALMKESCRWAKRDFPLGEAMAGGGFS